MHLCSQTNTISIWLGSFWFRETNARCCTMGAEPGQLAVLGRTCMSASGRCVAATQKFRAATANYCSVLRRGKKKTRQLGRLGPAAATCLASVPAHTHTRPTISVCPRRPFSQHTFLIHSCLAPASPAVATDRTGVCNFEMNSRCCFLNELIYNAGLGRNGDSLKASAPGSDQCEDRRMVEEKTGSKGARTPLGAQGVCTILIH